jgi:hypothetical protein
VDKERQEHTTSIDGIDPLSTDNHQDQCQHVHAEKSQTELNVVFRYVLFTDLPTESKIIVSFVSLPTIHYALARVFRLQISVERYMKEL